MKTGTGGKTFWLEKVGGDFLGGGGGGGDPQGHHDMSSLK